MKFDYFVESLKRIFKNKTKTRYNQETDVLIRGYSSLMLMAASVVMTIFNIVNGYTFMTYTTAILAIGFLTSALAAFALKSSTISGNIMAFLVGFMFTVYAVTGENEGFAILWIILVPILSMSLIGIYRGNLLCMYFLIFLIVIFYTPVNRYVSHVYTHTFQMRFPMLYLLSYVVSLYLMIQKDYYFYKTETMAYEDELSGLYNRRFYDEILHSYDEESLEDDFTIVSIDLNKLKYYNDTFGHEAGDELIASASKLFKENFNKAEAVCRTGGDEFMIITKVDKETFDQQLAELQKQCGAFEGKYVKTISIALGYAHHSEHLDMSVEELEKEADRKMYEAKADYYRQSGNDRRKR